MQNTTTCVSVSSRSKGIGGWRQARAALRGRPGRGRRCRSCSSPSTRTTPVSLRYTPPAASLPSPPPLRPLMQRSPGGTASASAQVVEKLRQLPPLVHPREVRLSLCSLPPLAALPSLSLSLSARAHADTTRESARVQVDKLKQLLAEASRGERFLLQGEPAPTALSCSPFPLTLRPSPSPSSSPPSSPSASRSSSPSPSPSPSSSPSSSVSLLARCPPQR